MTGLSITALRRYDEVGYDEVALPARCHRRGVLSPVSGQ